MVNNYMIGLCVKSVICGALFLSAFPHSGQSEVILQYFETRWDEMYQRLPEMAEIGYESIWTPPPGKSPIGGPYPYAYGGNVGYNSFDRFDLGDTPQRGHWETRYGSRTSLRNLVDNAHQLDMKIYPDIVFNHTGNGPDFRTYQVVGTENLAGTSWPPIGGPKTGNGQSQSVTDTFTTPPTSKFYKVKITAP